MNDNIFLDSNILIYCYTSTDIRKQDIARELVAKPNTFISKQVLNETINVLHKKYAVAWSALDGLITDFENNFFIHSLSPNEIRQACRLAERYKFSFYDSMIIAAAIECGCTKLFSEDLHNLQKFENDITVCNPF